MVNTQRGRVEKCFACASQPGQEEGWYFFINPPQLLKRRPALQRIRLPAQTNVLGRFLRFSIVYLFICPSYLYLMLILSMCCRLLLVCGRERKSRIHGLIIICAEYKSITIIIFNGKVDYKGSQQPHIDKVVEYKTIMTLIQLRMAVN